MKLNVRDRKRQRLKHIAILFQFETDHNQNYVTKCATQSDDEHAHPSYSDVISSIATGEGL